MTEATGADIPAALPLSGVRVLDLTRVMTGPYCTMMLGDLGADVIKVEMPGRGDDTRAWGPPFVEGEAIYFLSVNRNKRSIALDLKSDGGKAALWRLIERSDVLVENFSPGALARLGFDADAARARNPRLIYASISGFGQFGPDYDRTAYDLIVQGMSGMMSITGQPDGLPTRLGVPIADIGAGMFAAFAIAAALVRRAATGQGCVIDTSMLGGQVAMLTYQAGNYFATGKVASPLGNAHPMIVPYDTFACADGHVNISVGNDAMWQRFCGAIDRPDLLDVEIFRTNAGRVTNKAAVYAEIEPALRALSRDEIVRRLDAASVPCGPIHRLDDALTGPQVAAQGLVQEVMHPRVGRIRLTGAPYHFDGAAAEPRLAPPLLGQQTREILAEAGFADEEIAALLNDRAAEEPTG
ncbi:MAG: CoA transferase [Thermomicrobiales bacterium]|nr:CoA transferase [Thermomicrobiales bacterium]